MKRKITWNGRFFKSTVLLSFFLTALFFASCEKEDSMEPAVPTTYNMNNERLNPATEITNEATASELKSLVPEEAMIYIHHGACTGSCPAYSVAILSNGNVVYSGYRNVGTIGTIRFDAGSDVVQRLTSEMIRSGFLDLQPVYPSAGPDAARTVTALRIGNNHDDLSDENSKLFAVVDYGVHVPLLLPELRQRIEIQLGIDRLVRTDAATQELPVQTNSTR